MQKKSSTERSEEIVNFNKNAANWWDKSHPFYPLVLFNKLRVPFIKDALRSVGKTSLEKVKILDVGCGGGFLSEQLAVEGAHVTGLDLADDVLQVAKAHLLQTKQTYLFKKTSLNQLVYIKKDIVDFAKENKEQYDVVVSSEAIEHVDNPASFLKGCADCVKPGSVAVITTPNRSWLSYFAVIFMGERVCKILPQGTHHYSQFISPKQMECMAAEVGLKKLDCRGTVYLPPPVGLWILVPTFLSVNYMMSFRKLSQ